MTKGILALGLLVALVLPAQLQGSAAHAAASHRSAGAVKRSKAQKKQHCTLRAYSARLNCVIVPPANDVFYVAVPTTSILLKSNGTKDTAGTEVDVDRVVNPCPSTKAQSFAVFLDGPIPALNLITKGAALYKFTGAACKLVSHVTGAGIYEVVLAGGSTPGAPFHP